MWVSTDFKFLICLGVFKSYLNAYVSSAESHLSLRVSVVRSAEKVM